MAEIYSIVYQTEHSQHIPPYHFSRTPIDEVNLLLGYGIEGDLKGGKREDRQLNIMSYETLCELATEGCDIEPGRMGEQIIIRGVRIETLPPGTRLQIGDTAQVEIVKLRTGCSWFEQVQGVPVLNVEGRLGMMAKVAQSGPIRVGDAVRVLAPISS